MEVFEQISRRGSGTQDHFTLHCLLHFELNNYKQIRDLNKAVAWCDPTALHDRIMEKNVPGQLNPMRPSATNKQPELFCVVCKIGAKGRLTIMLFYSVVCTHA